MKNDVCIKAGSYCPICKGVVLADCRHDSIQFSVPMRYQRMEFNAQLQNEVKKLTVQRDELLEALKKTAEHIEAMMAHIEHKPERFKQHCWQQARNARAAIAKAEGGAA